MASSDKLANAATPIDTGAIFHEVSPRIIAYAKAQEYVERTTAAVMFSYPYIVLTYNTMSTSKKCHYIMQASYVLLLANLSAPAICSDALPLTIESSPSWSRGGRRGYVCTWCLRLFNVVVLLMTVIAFVLCLVKGNDHQTYYLLACNTVISSLIGIVVNWWYRGGDLGAEKYWYIFLVGVVILFQCVTTDIYVFHVLPTPTTTTTTEPITRFTTNFTTHNISMVTINHSSTVKP